VNSFEVLVVDIFEKKANEMKFVEMALQNPNGIHDFFNNFALNLAQYYFENKITYEVCDFVATWLSGVMINEKFLSIEGYEVPSPAYDVFLAFDAGEYTHSNDDENIDPVNKYTNRQIEAILNANQRT